MATLFVAGATGYTGAALVRLAAGVHEVHAHIRPGAKGDAAAAALADLPVRVERCPWEEAAMVVALRRIQPNVVFGLLGTTRARSRAAARAGGPVEDYETVDKGLTLMLLRAAEDCGSRPRFVYLSSLGADRPAGNAYLRARHEVEQALRASTLPWTIARPSFITGPDRAEDRPAERAAAAVARVALGGLKALGIRQPWERFGELDAATLAQGLLRAALDPAAEGAVWETAALRGA